MLRINLWQVAFAAVAVFGFGTYFILWGLLDSPASLPDNDYWGAIGRIFPDGNLTLDPHRWLARNNEHITFIPNLIFAANVLLTNGHNLGLQLTAFGLSICIAFLLILLLPEAATRTWWAFAAAVLVIALLTFTRHAAHNWFLGFSGIIWFGANLLFLCTIVTLRVACDRNSAAWLAAGTACAVGSYLTYSTGTMAILLGLVFLLWRRAPKPWIAGYAVICAIAIAATIGTLARPEPHPEWVFDLSVLIQFVGQYLGTFALHYLTIEVGAGLFGLALYAIALVAIVRKEPLGQGDLAPWILVATYPLGTALITAFSRAGFGIGAATPSRYASLPALFWTALLIASLTLAITNRHRLRRLGWLCVFAGTGIPILAGSMHTSFVEMHIDRNHHKRLAEIALVAGITDPVLLRSFALSIPQFISAIENLKQMPHVPFAARPECAQWLGRQIRPAEAGEVGGHVDTAAPGSTGHSTYFEIRGWAALAGKRARCVAIIDDTGTAVGVGIAGFRRPDVMTALGIGEPRAGWRALTPISSTGPWQAAALFSQHGGWRRLGSCFRLEGGGNAKTRVAKCE